MTAKSQKTVLVVDDEPVMVRLLQVNFEAEGYRVLTARDGAEAVRQTLLEHPDLIILDILMPTMDGYEALEIIKSTPETADIPVIVLTGKRKLEDIAEGWKYDIEFYLTKPYAIEDLLELSRRILEDREESKL
ncbi:MAG TPA: response regulator [Armatimonadetes bacterium]|nr:response regulator [Armatimonadota bacterium]